MKNNTLKDKMEQQGNWLFKYRGILPIILLFAGTGFYLQTEINPSGWILENSPFESYYEMLCLIISLFGFAIRVYAVGYSPDNTSGRNTQNQVADVLNTTGIYSIVRNPLYIGNFFMWTGIALLSGNFWFVGVFLLFYILYYERIIVAEESFLLEKFGKEYLEWVEKTPAVLPVFRKFRKSPKPFNWKKVLRQEKNGLAALFFIFCFYNVVGELIEHSVDFNYFLVAACILTLAGYCVLKYMKYNTNLLK
ncbi:MAG: isoprenylcysteine carboxylmethyltransferase family protein [Bacteroidota bacterium]